MVNYRVWGLYFRWQLNVHCSLLLQSQWKKGSCVKNETQYNWSSTNCLAWEATLSPAKIYLKLITLCRYCIYYCWCSVWISCCTGCCWNISLVDLGEKEAQHERHWRWMLHTCYALKWTVVLESQKYICTIFFLFLRLGTIFSSLSTAWWSLLKHLYF